MRIYKDFQFEAAHFLPTAPEGHPNARLHGHSFRARVSIDGQPDPKTGLILNLCELDEALKEVQGTLDHRLLNDVEGLGMPTLERIALFVWNKLSNRVPGLAEVEIARDSCAEGCIYRGPSHTAIAAE